MAYYSTSTDLSYTPLTAKEEARLFRVYHSRKCGSLKARDKIIFHYLKFTAKVALGSCKGVLPDDEAISAGNLGLMQALNTRRFNPRRGLRFSAYLRKFIRGQVFDSMVRSQCVRRASLTERNEFGEDATLTGTLYGKEPTHLGNLPFENAVDESYETRHLNMVRRDALLHVMRILTPAEKRVIKSELEGRTQTETAKKLGCCRQAVGNLRFKALSKLKAALLSQKHDLL